MPVLETRPIRKPELPTCLTAAPSAKAEGGHPNANLADPRAEAFTALRPEWPVRIRKSSRMLWMRRDGAYAPCPLLGCDSAFHADLGRTTLGLREALPDAPREER